MRLVFQGFSVYVALVSTVLIAALAFEFSEWLTEAIAKAAVNISYVAFGPLLLTFVNMGFAHFKQISFTCSPRGITHHVNFCNICILLFCFVLSLCITFTMLMQKTIDMA